MTAAQILVLQVPDPEPLRHVESGETRRRREAEWDRERGKPDARPHPEPCACYVCACWLVVSDWDEDWGKGLSDQQRARIKEIIDKYPNLGSKP